MRFLSLDDNEAGFIAIGAAPIGVIAIGGMAVGVVAIGFGAVGLVAVTCGASFGALSVSCGISAGGYATGVGLAFGVRSSCVGLALSVLPEDGDPRPRKSNHARELASAKKVSVDIAELSTLGASGWVKATPIREANGSWRLAESERPVMMESSPQSELDDWNGEDPPVLVHLVCDEVPDAEAPAADYRSAPGKRLVFRCDRVLVPSTKANENVGPSPLWFFSKIAIKAALLLAVAGGAAAAVVDRFDGAPHVDLEGGTLE